MALLAFAAALLVLDSTAVARPRAHDLCKEARAPWAGMAELGCMDACAEVCAASNAGLVGACGCDFGCACQCSDTPYTSCEDWPGCVTVWE